MLQRSLLALYLSVFVALSADAKEDDTLRLLTYNIHHCEGLDGRKDIERTAAVIKAAKPDLVALQEVDYKTRRSGNVDQAAELGKLCGMNAVFGRAIDYKGGQYGNALLSVKPFLDTHNYRLPKGGAENRTMIAGMIPLIRRQTLTFASTHFDHKNTKSRTDAASMLADLVPKSTSFVIIAGDLNCKPDAAELRPLATVLRSVNTEPLPTFPAHSPSSQIDYILLDQRARWTVESVEVIDDDGASDHRPLLAVIRIRK